MQMTKSTARAGWSTLLALALLSGPVLAQDASDAPGDEVAVGDNTVDGETDAGANAGPDAGVIGDDGELIDPILYTDYAPLPDEGTTTDGTEPGDPAAPLPADEGDGLPVDSDCGGCEIQSFGGAVNDAGPLMAPAVTPLSLAPRRAGHGEVARAGSENICTSREHYVAWLCEWQGFARP